MAGGSQVAVAGEKRLYLHEFLIILNEELHKLLSCIQTVHVFH